MPIALLEKFKFDLLTPGLNRLVLLRRLTSSMSTYWKTLSRKLPRKSGTSVILTSQSSSLMSSWNWFSLVSRSVRKDDLSPDV